VVKGIEAVLRADSRDIDLHFEYMDTKRYYEDQYLDDLYEMYQYKFKHMRFDVVIVSDNNALSFVNTYHKELFPGTPVVFCGINNYSDAMVNDPSLFTGTVEEIDIKSTLEIALKLHPDITKVISINDSTTTGMAVKNQVLGIAPLFEDRADLVFVEDFNIEELKEQVWKLPRDSIILLSVVTRDRSGQFFAYEESLAYIYSETSAPIYSFWDTYLGKGIVGGKLISGFHQGKSAAQIALRILGGERAASIPVVRESPNSYMFDYQQLKLFGLEESDLPEGSIIINQPDTLYSRHRTLVLTILFTITSLLIVIAALLTIIRYRKKMERVLRESEERYRDFYENAPDMFHSLNKDGIVIDCNETGARMLGYRKEEIIGRPISDFFTAQTKKIDDEEFPKLKHRRVHLDREREFVRKDGSTFTASLNIYTEVDDNGELVKTKAIARDLTERRRVEELKKSREQLRSLSAYLERAREEEKKRIARQIHDELGHALTTLGLDLSWLSSRLSRDRDGLDIDTLRLRTQAMSELIDATVQTVQRISSELIPGVLDHLGLSEAIKWQVDKFRERTGIKYSMSIDPENIMLDQSSSLTVFRIFQETLTNIIRHADAEEVHVGLKESDSTLELEIKDNGKGIEMSQISSPESIGLIGMRERARILGGRVMISGSPGEGTTVKVFIPLQLTDAGIEK
jgi:PAS domain S-box-containing protein